MKLKSHQELIAHLDDVKQEDEDVLLCLSVDYKLSIPDHSISLQDIKKLVGKDISIFRLDDNYYFKKLEGDFD